MITIRLLMNRAPVTAIVSCLLIAAGVSRAQTIDRIVAVVDNDLILDSELKAQVQFFVLNNKVDPKTPGLEAQVLQSMINEKLIVARAIEDSVVVTDDEVQRQLDALIQQRIQQFGSQARLEEMYGMPLSRIKVEYRDEMRKNLLAQRLQQQRFGTESVGRLEVEEFFKTFKDSLPRVPEEVELAHIMIKPKFTEQAKTVARAKMQLLLDSIKAGVDFGDLARRHSEDPGSAPQGGDLGFVRRGQFVNEFESAAFALNENEVSGIVETELGFHIIQLLERRGDAVRVRHILLRIGRTGASDDSTIVLLDSVRARYLAGESFAELAKRYSEDKESNLIGGNLGTFELDQLDKNWQSSLVGLKEGDVSKPVRLPWGNSYVYHIILVKKRTLPHTMSLEQDYHKIETLALNYKRTKDYQAWIDELKSKIYWQIRL